MEDLNLQVPAPTPFPPPQRAKNSTLAFLFSVLVPGAGHFYCGKITRGLLTLFFFGVSLAGLVFLYPKVAEEKMDVLWGMCLRSGILLYVFGFLDPFFTAREINSGEDPHIIHNPRVAAALNVLTRGFGYWYVGARAKGLLVFLVIGTIDRAGMTLVGPAGMGLAVFVELALAAAAVDAYRIARQEVRERLEVMSPTASAAPLPAPEALSPAVPLGLAGVMLATYTGFVALGLLLPEYDKLDHSQVVVREEETGQVFSNPRYGVEMHVPVDWTFNRSDATVLVAAERFDGACQTMLTVEAVLPFIDPEFYSDSVIEQVRSTHNTLRVKERNATRLSGMPAHEVVVAAEVGETTVEQHYVIARRGMTMYSFISTTAGDFTEICQRDVTVIRQQVVLSK